MRLGVVLLVALLHLAAVLALVRAFAPDFTTRVAEEVVAAFTVTVTTPPPPVPAPTPSPAPRAPDAAGAAGEAGRKATPRDASAPQARIVIVTRPVPQVAGTGAANSSGARDSGSGTGAGGQGSDTGSGASGRGQGGGGAAKAVKISGDINATRDYPEKSREQRLGDYVIVALTIGDDGKVRACRIHRPSRDPEADRITCQLATSRFRFRPATDAAGNPVESIYGWQQRWFPPREKGGGSR